MKKVLCFFVLVLMTMVNVNAHAEILLWENIGTMAGMNYFESEVVDASTNDFILRVYDPLTMETKRPVLRWRWVRDDANADWSYSYAGPLVGARMTDGHNPSWDLLEVQYEDGAGNFVAFNRQPVAFSSESATKFYGGVNFRRIYFATTKKYSVMVESKFAFIISIFDEDGNAKLTEREVVEESVLIGELSPGDIITVTPHDGERIGLTQEYIFK